MNRLEKIITIGSEWESQIIEAELRERNIPHVMKSYHDSALDGIYQTQGGWGHIEAPPEFKEEIVLIVRSLQNRPASETSGVKQEFEGEITKQSSGKRILKLVVVFIAVFGIIAGAIDLRERYIRSHYLPTTGRVVSLTYETKLEQSGRLDGELRTKYLSKVTVEYRVADKPFFKDDILDRKDINVGDTVKVLYSKTNPAKCIVIMTRKQRSR